MCPQHEGKIGIWDSVKGQSFTFSAALVLKGGFEKFAAYFLVEDGSCSQLGFTAVSMDSNGFSGQNVFSDLLVKW